MSSKPEEKSTPGPGRKWGVVDSEHGKVAGNIPCGIGHRKGDGSKCTKVGGFSKPRKDT